MNRILIRFWFVMVAVLVGGSILVSGCGTKIAIPEPVGLFSVSAYIEYDRYDDPALQVAVSQGAVFVLKADSLSKKDLEYGPLADVGGLQDARALCIDELGQVVFVWNQGSQQVDWYSTNDLILIGSTPLSGILSVSAMVTSDMGIDQVPGATTFLYLSDPEAGLIHRYVFDEFNGLNPYGILARADGDAARFVHVASGMARDWDNHLLVCDVDTNRNWVIRFDSTPDLDDTTSDPDDQDPWRGFAALYTDPVCATPAANEYVLGNAASCNETGWVGAPSSEEGEFHIPSFVAVDGSGRIFVADTGNSRVQTFTPQGDFELFFGNEETCPSPGSMGVVDVRIGGGLDEVNYGAFVYIVIPSENQVRRFISSEHYIELNKEPPPPQ
jgi:hypothetical protein